MCERLMWELNKKENGPTKRCPVRQEYLKNKAELSQYVLLITGWTIGSALWIQGQLPRVEGRVCVDARAPLRFMCKEGESPESLWAFPSCLINKRMKLINMKMPFLFFAVFHFRHNSPKMRKQTLRLLLRSPRPPSAAAVSRCRVSALAAWRTSRCWRPSWGPIPAVTSCMWWTPGPRSAHCEKQPDSVFLHVQVGFNVFKLRPVSWMCL